MDRKSLNAIALTVRSLTMDAVQKANSGHPGLPMGLAELGALLYGEILKIHPAEPGWMDRDRLVLSAGHGCMLLYSLLHLAGFDVSMEDIRRFRQLGSKAAGHPEYGLAPGVETTTGPLGQGFANAVGMALAERMMAARFNTADHSIIDHHTYAIAGDGCMMEGVTAEAASLAGHLGLGRLIVYYDSNSITIEGPTSLAFSEDVGARFQAYGWHVQSGSAYDAEDLLTMTEAAKEHRDAPSLIILESLIGKGSPNKAGSHEVHGAPLGDDEVMASKRALGLDPEKDFYVHPDAVAHFERRKVEWARVHGEWVEAFASWAAANPELHDIWRSSFEAVDLSSAAFPGFQVGEKVATRSAGGKVLNSLAKAVPNLVGGSADLAPSNKSVIDGAGHVEKGRYQGRNLHFGVREHAMGGVTNGLALHGGLRPYCATFFVFTDYMRPAIRLAAMMKLPVIYLFTHDSIFVGEDGPTHQPVEHLAAMRAIPGIVILRPADAQETEAAWEMALCRTDGPTALVLTRQNLEVFYKHDRQWRDTVKRGAYVAKEARGSPKLVVVATGSEVSLAVEAVRDVGEDAIRVVSMMSRELFLSQDQAFRSSILPPDVARLAVETGVSLGWEGLGGGNIVGIDRFGESAPCADLAKHFGFDREAVARRIRSLL